MQVSYQKDFNHHYLMIQSLKEVEPETYPMRMLLGNSIPSLLPCRVLSTDGKQSFCYDVAGVYSLASSLEKIKLGESRMKLLLRELLKAIENIQACLMDVNQLVFLPEYMYEDREGEQIRLCYLPGYEQDIRSQFRSFMEYLLPMIDHEDSQAVVMGYGIYRKSMEEDFRLEQIQQCMYQEALPEEEVEPVHTPEELQRQEKRQEALTDFFKEDTEPKETQKIPWGTMAISGIWTVVLLGIGAMRLTGHLSFLTFPMLLGIVIAILGVIAVNVLLWKKDRPQEGVLSVAKSRGKMAKASIQWPGKRAVEPEEIRQIYPSREVSPVEEDISPTVEELEKPAGAVNLYDTQPLPRLSTVEMAKLISKHPEQYPDILLTGDLTILGKLKDAVDVVIDRPTVSRVHGKIRRVDQEYYLMDLNSKNGTSLNGITIPSQENCRMMPGDEILFADAGYTFSL